MKNDIMSKLGVRSKIGPSLNVLYGVTITVTVTLSTVTEGCRSGPGKGDEALICVPGIDHAVECRIRGVHLEVHELAVPIGDELLLFLLHNGEVLVCGEDLVCHPRLCLTEQERNFLRLAGL